MLRLNYLLRSPQVRPYLLRSTHTHNVSPNVRRVRFRRPWVRSFISSVLLYGTAFHLWSTFVLVQFDDEKDNEDTPTEEASSRQHSQESNETLGTGSVRRGALFIPLGWSRLQEGEFYAASDPEWQQFRKFSQDPDKIDALKDELAHMVLHDVGDHMLEILGGPLFLTETWLVHQFPSRAPPGYVRSGVEIANGTISRVTKPLSPEIGDRLQTFMKPMNVVVAIKDAYMVLLSRQLDRFRNPTGTANPVGTPFHFTMMGNERGKWVGEQEQPKMQSPSTDGLKENMPPNTENSNYHPSALISFLQRISLPDFGPGSELHLASQVFKSRLKHEEAFQSAHTPRRGVFFITGPVGLEGPNGGCRFEVCGEFDPAKRQWRTVHMKLKDVNMNTQRPGRD